MMGMNVEPWDALTLEVARLSTELRNARSLLAAVVCQYGEAQYVGALGDGRYRLTVDRPMLENVDGMQLRVILEPNSGAVLLRLGPPAA